MKPIKKKNNYEVTKDAINTAFNGAARAAYVRGDDAGWKRGFRMGGAAGMAAQSVLILLAYAAGCAIAAVFP